MVDVTGTVEEASAVMRQEGTEWVGVLEGDRLLGWLWDTDLDGKVNVADCVPRRFRTTIQAAASLREALDAVVNTRNQAAVVLEGDRYLGMVFLDQISEGCWNEGSGTPNPGLAATAGTSQPWVGSGRRAAP